MSVEAQGQLLDLLRDLEDAANSDEHDIWRYIWGSGFYLASKAYRHLTGTRHMHSSSVFLFILDVV